MSSVKSERGMEQGESQEDGQGTSYSKMSSEDRFRRGVDTIGEAYAKLGRKVAAVISDCHMEVKSLGSERDSIIRDAARTLAAKDEELEVVRKRSRDLQGEVSILRGSDAELRREVGLLQEENARLKARARSMSRELFFRRVERTHYGYGKRDPFNPSGPSQPKSEESEED